MTDHPWFIGAAQLADPANYWTQTDATVTLHSDPQRDGAERFRALLAPQERRDA